MELIKQSNYSPYPIEEQVVSIWAGTEGKLDDIPVGDVRRFEAEFLEHLRHSHRSTLDAIAANEWGDDIIAALDDAIAKFKDRFLAKDEGIRVNELEAAAMANGVESRETVTRHVAPVKQG
jgi:F-type H+-transporting ATPase subunit alpha